MKPIKFIILSLILIPLQFGFKSVFAEIPPQIFESLKIANIEQLSPFLSSSVELQILEKDDIYSKSQSTIIIKSFFDKITIKTFSILHQGGKEEAQYAICQIIDTNGKKYRIYFLVKEINKKTLIHQFRIEEE